MSVLESLNKIEAINRRFAETGEHTQQCNTSGAVISLRLEFAMECSNLLLAVSQDPKIFSDRTLFIEFQDSLSELRKRASHHQMHWQSAEINANKQAYFKASENLNADVRRFVEMTRVKLHVTA